MKRKVVTVLLCGVLLVLFSACGSKHEHTWKDASCTEPKTCTECGATEGEASEHMWVDATCEVPRTCSKCGETEGSPIEHSWTDATCIEPETCSICGDTKGEPLGHDLSSATFDTPATCKVCGITEGGKLKLEEIDLPFANSNTVVLNENRFANIVWKNHIALSADIYDIDGKKVASVSANANTVPDEGYYGVYGDIFGLKIVVWGKDDDPNKLYFYFYVADGNELNIEGRAYGLNYIKHPESNVIEGFNDKGEFVGAIDSESRKWIDKDTYGEPACSLPKLEDDYRFVSYDEYADAIMTYSNKNKNWRFVSRDGKELATYLDATGFCDSGIAFATNDGNSYFAIDTDFNVIGENVIDAVYSNMLGGKYAQFKDVTGKARYYQVVMETAADTENDTVETAVLDNDDNSLSESSASSEEFDADGNVRVEALVSWESSIDRDAVIATAEGGQINILYYVSNGEGNSHYIGGSQSRGWNTLALGDNFMPAEGKDWEQYKDIEKWYVGDITYDASANVYEVMLFDTKY